MITPITKEMTFAQAEEAYEENIRSLFAPGLNGGIVLVIDVTGSMGAIINALTTSLTKYADVMFKGQIDRLGLVCMDDHYVGRGGRTLSSERAAGARGESTAVLFKQSTRDPAEFKKWLKGHPSGSGADEAEAWACAIDHARKLDPEANIWLCTDAPPHGSKWGDDGDFYPEGCPCGIDLDLTNVSFIDFSWKARGHYIPNDMVGIAEQEHRKSIAALPIGSLGWNSSFHGRLAKANPDAMIPFSMPELDNAFKKFLGGS